MKERVHDLAGEKVLVTGASGLLGRPLVNALIKRGAIVTGTGVEFTPKDWPEHAHYLQTNLRDGWFIEALEQGGPFSYVFHLAGAKGGVGIGRLRAADFFTENVRTLMNVLPVIEGVEQKQLKRFLYVSSVGAYPGKLTFFTEDEIWEGAPHLSDFFGGCAKRFGEVLCAAYKEQFGLDYVVVRPTNCFGPYDRFDPQTGMVIAALIARIESGENPLIVWGKSSAQRDFLYSVDAAEQMIAVMERGAKAEAYNLGTGFGLTIENLLELLKSVAYPHLDWRYDASKPSGPECRIMDIHKLIDLGWTGVSAVGTALKETVEWYQANRSFEKYDPFNKHKKS